MRLRKHKKIPRGKPQGIFKKYIKQPVLKEHPVESCNDNHD